MSLLDGLFVATPTLVVAPTVATLSATIDPGYLYPVQAQAEDDVTLTIAVAALGELAGKRIAIKMVGEIEGTPNAIAVVAPTGTQIQNDSGDLVASVSFVHENGGYREWICSDDGEWFLICKLAAAASVSAPDALQFDTDTPVPLTTRPTLVKPYLRFDGTNIIGDSPTTPVSEWPSKIRSVNLLDEDFDDDSALTLPGGWQVWQIDSTNKATAAVMVAETDYKRDARAGDPSPISGYIPPANTFIWYVENGWLWISVGTFTNGNLAWFIGRRIASRAQHHSFRSRVCLSKSLAAIAGGTFSTAVGRETNGRPDLSTGVSAGWNTSSGSMKPYLNGTLYSGVNTSGQIIIQDHEFELNFSGTTCQFGVRGGSLNILGTSVIADAGFAPGNPVYAGFYFAPSQIGGFDYLRERSSAASPIHFR